MDIRVNTGALERKLEEEYLFDYVRHKDECQENPTCMRVIQNYIKEYGKEMEATTTVYRGQKGARMIRATVPWFSVSRDREVSEDFLNNSESRCCMFLVHLLPGAKYIDVNKELTKLKYETRHIYSFEKELLVLGGGTFWKDRAKSAKGFKQISDGVYETWYSTPGSSAYSTPRRSVASGTPKSTPASSPRGATRGIRTTFLRNPVPRSPRSPRLARMLRATRRMNSNTNDD